MASCGHACKRGRKGGRRGCALRRRYGRASAAPGFKLPKVSGAKKVMAAKKADVAWLARTDPQAKTVEFSEAWARLSPEGRRYIVLHEQAHLLTGVDHDTRFYEALKRLVAEHRVSWKVAYELESYNCHASH